MIIRSTWFLLAFGVVACSSFDTYSPNQTHRAIKPHPNHKGVYLIYYRRHQLIDEYGPGVENVRRDIQKNPDNWRVIWDKAAAEAVTHYMTEKELVPPECVNGIVVISSLGDEAGGGTSAFRCK